MARGNPTITFRITPDLLGLMDAELERRNEKTREAPWERSDFIRAAIRERIDHIRRSRKKKPVKAVSYTPRSNGTTVTTGPIEQDFMSSNYGKPIGGAQ